MKDTIITFTKEQVKAITDAFSRGESITIEPPKPVITKWEPKGGNYYPDESLTNINSGCLGTDRRLSGLGYASKYQAEQAAKALRSYARQLAWLTENDDGWVADWKDTSKQKYYIYYDEKTNDYTINSNQIHKNINTIYMSRKNAEKLCQLLNDGIVEF